MPNLMRRLPTALLRTTDVRLWGRKNFQMILQKQWSAPSLGRFQVQAHAQVTSIGRKRDTVITKVEAPKGRGEDNRNGFNFPPFCSLPNASPSSKCPFAANSGARINLGISKRLLWRCMTRLSPSRDTIGTCTRRSNPRFNGQMETFVVLR